MSTLFIIAGAALILGIYSASRIKNLRDQLDDTRIRLQLAEKEVRALQQTFNRQNESLPGAESSEGAKVPGTATVSEGLPPVPSGTQEFTEPIPEFVTPDAAEGPVLETLPAPSESAANGDRFSPGRAPEPIPPTLPTIAPEKEPALTPPAVSTPIGSGSPRFETWEGIIGGSWLSRIGVTMLVLGITFALGYTLTKIGPLGKALLATTTSLVMLTLGVFAERRESYRYYARGLIGGGWAALYATAYAVHELEATRIVENPFTGFALLILVGVGMIIHSLRYRNQGLTTIAYGLGYAAIVLHSISAYTLAAATLLGLGTMLHLWRRQWYGVALGGIAATYGSLFLWYLRQDPLTFDTLRLGLTALVIEWLVFLVADFWVQPEGGEQRNNSRAVSLLNAFAANLLAYAAWSNTFPARAWVPPALFGFVYIITSAILRRWRRPVTHQMHSLVATLLLSVAAAVGLSVTSAAWFFLIQAQIVVLIGVTLKDLFHRRLGSVLFLFPLVAIGFEQIIFRTRLPDGSFDLQRFLLSSAACGCFYLTHFLLSGFRTADGDQGKHEEIIRRCFSYGAFVVILQAAWVQLPRVWVALALVAFAVLLFEISRRSRWPDLRIQAWVAAGLVVLAVIFFTAPSEALVRSVHARALVMIPVAIAFVFLFRRMAGERGHILDEDATLRRALTWAGVAIAALAVWLDARPPMVGPLWLLLALLLVELGLTWNEVDLRRPGFPLLLGSHLSLLLSNVTATSEIMGLSVRTATVVPAIAATYYLWWRLRELPSRDEPAGDDWDEKMGRLLSYVGVGMAGLYFRFQFGLDGAAMRWSLAMIVLFFLGYWLRDADFRIQAYALGTAVFVRAIGFDFRHASSVLGIDGPFTVALVCVMAYLGAGFYLRSRTQKGQEKDRRSLALESRLARQGTDLMWILGVALAALYLYRTQSGSILIVAWALEGLIVTAGGFAFRAASLRMAGLGLLGLALALTLVRTFTTFDTIGRIVSFTVLGLILLLVSLGYTRFREWFRKKS